MGIMLALVKKRNVELEEKKVLQETKIKNIFSIYDFSM